MATEFQVKSPGEPGVVAEDWGNFPFGASGVAAEIAEGKKYIRFKRPLVCSYVHPHPDRTDDRNGMWIPDRLLKSADPT